jgi:chromosome partitioning protein
MATVIAIVNMKGGVGKSTVANNLSHTLVKRGKKVLVIDMDPQATLTFLFGQDERILQEGEKTIYFALVKDKPLSSMVIHGTPALIPSSIILSKAERDLMSNMRYSSTMLRERLREIQDAFDFIVIDCPPALNILTSNALAAARFVLVPVKTDILSILGVPILLDDIENVRVRDNYSLQILGVLPTIYNKNFNNDKEALQTLQTVLREKRIPLLDPIPRSTLYDRAAAVGTPMVLKSEDGPGVDVFYKLADQIINNYG